MALYVPQSVSGECRSVSSYGVARMESLERWLIRESVRSQISHLLRADTVRDRGKSAAGSEDDAVSARSSRSESNGTDVPGVSSQSSIVSMLVRHLRDFPLFRDDARMIRALKEVFSLFPRLDKALKARKGTTSLENALVSLISGPIISASRGSRKSHSDSQEETSQLESIETAPSSFTELASEVMDVIIGSPDGVKLFLEELKSAQSIRDLRPFIQRSLALMRANWTRKFIHAVRRRPGELKAQFDRLPKQMIVTSLKMRPGATTGNIAVQVLFLRPFGSMSLWQRFLLEALNVEVTREELERVSQFLSERCRATLRANAETLIAQFDDDAQEQLYSAVLGSQRDQAEGSVEGPEQLKARRRLVLQFLERNDVDSFRELKEEPEKWAALRFVELVLKKQGLDELVYILGGDEFTASLRSILSSSKTMLADSLLSKGSGMVKLVEEAFACLDAGFRLAEGPLRSDDAELGRRFSLMLEEVQTRLINVLHLVLTADSDLVLHESLSWLVDLYRHGKSIQLPSIEVLTKSLPEEVREGIFKEAELVRQREAYNATRAFGAARLPRPKLIHSRRLIDVYCEVISENFGRLAASSSAKYPRDQLAFSPSPTARTRPGSFIADLELTWNESQASSAKDRGFVLCGATESVQMWCRAVGHRHDDSAVEPIVAVEIDYQRRSDTGDWIYIPRNINKGVFGAPRVFLKYKRRIAPAGDHHPAPTARLTGIYLVDASDSARHQALSRLPGWTRIASFRNSFLFESVLWTRFT